jgi:hypothetical protein
MPNEGPLICLPRVVMRLPTKAELFNYRSITAYNVALKRQVRLARKHQFIIQSFFRSAPAGLLDKDLS